MERNKARASLWNECPSDGRGETYQQMRSIKWDAHWGVHPKCSTRGVLVVISLGYTHPHGTTEGFPREQVGWTDSERLTETTAKAQQGGTRANGPNVGGVVRRSSQRDTRARHHTSVKCIPSSLTCCGSKKSQIKEEGHNLDTESGQSQPRPAVS